MRDRSISGHILFLDNNYFTSITFYELASPTSRSDTPNLAVTGYTSGQDGAILLTWDHLLHVCPAWKQCWLCWVINHLEQFSIECRKTKTKVITLANQKRHRQYSEPIKTRSNYMLLTQSAGKREWVSCDWFWFYFWLDEKVARVF